MLEFQESQYFLHVKLRNYSKAIYMRKKIRRVLNQTQTFCISGTFCLKKDATLAKTHLILQQPLTP